MKKLSIVLLALAIGVFFAVPAMAIHVGDVDSPEGSLGISGAYSFDAEARDYDGVKSDFFDDDFDLSIVLEKGNLKGYVSLELSDRDFEGAAGGSPGGSKLPAVDNYYIQWGAMDNLKVKFGEYGLSFGRNIGTYLAGASNIQLTYSMDAFDISATLSKEVDEHDSSSTAPIASEDDDDTLVIRLSAKDVGPFTKLNVISYTQMNDVSTTENSYIGVDLALPIGPVDLAFEYGGNGGDLEGNFMLVEIGLDELVGFGLNVNYFLSSDDYLAAYDGNDWSPVIIFGDNLNGAMTDTSALWVDLTYDVDDKLTVGVQALIAAENDAGAEWGTEVDVGGTYKIADNVTFYAAYGTYSEGDMGEGDYTELFSRLKFSF